MGVRAKIERRPNGLARIAPLFVLVALLLAAGCGGHVQPAHAEPAVGHSAMSQCLDDHGESCHEAGPHEDAVVTGAAKRTLAPYEVAPLVTGVLGGGPDLGRVVRSGPLPATDPPRKPAGRHHLLLVQIART